MDNNKGCDPFVICPNFQSIQGAAEGEGFIYIAFKKTTPLTSAHHAQYATIT